MATKPIPGANLATWGATLNTFLDEGHNADGTLRESAVQAAARPLIFTASITDSVYGASPAASGAANVTAINAAIASGLPVWIPEGDFTINATLTPPAGATLLGGGPTSRLVGGATTPATNLISIGAVSNVTIRNLGFAATTATRAIFIQGGEGITIDGCTVNGLELVLAEGAPGFTYATLTEATQARRLRVTNNHCVGIGGVSAGTGIYIAWSRNVVIAHNTVEDYMHGIGWWGGSADPISGDGAAANPRWANDYTIQGNVVRDMAGGGIWGSMGEGISITGNVVEECGDICIDLEGTNFATVTGNTARNGVNSCYSLFFTNNGIVFAGNVAISDVDDRKLFWITGNQFSPDNKNISFVGNTLLHNGAGIGRCFIEGAVMVSNFLFADNILSNVKVDFYPTQGGGFSVRDNRLLFTNVAGAAFDAIRGGGQIHTDAVTTINRTEISGNQVLSRVTQPAGSRAIYSVMQVFTGAATIRVDGNMTEGFPIDLECLTIAQTGTVVPRQIVQGNVFTAGVFTRTDAGSDVARVLLENNRLATGAPYPAATPASGKWDVGQIAYAAAPAAGGFIGAVCTTAGSPGTWRNWGAIA